MAALPFLLEPYHFNLFSGCQRVHLTQSREEDLMECAPDEKEKSFSRDGAKKTL